MNRLGLEPLHVGALTGEVLDTDQTISVVLRGDSDARDAGTALDDFLVKRVHPAVMTAGLKLLQLDVTGLEWQEPETVPISSLTKKILSTSS